MTRRVGLIVKIDCEDVRCRCIVDVDLCQELCSSRRGGAQADMINNGYVRFMSIEMLCSELVFH